MARECLKTNSLIEAAFFQTLDMKPPLGQSAHVGRDDGDLLPIGILPTDGDWPRPRARANEPTANEPVDIELQAVFERCSPAGTRHHETPGFRIRASVAHL